MWIFIIAVGAFWCLSIGFLLHDKINQVIGYLYQKLFPLSYKERSEKLDLAEKEYLIRCLSHLLHDKIAVDLIYKEVNQCKTLQDLATLQDSAIDKLAKCMEIGSLEYVMHLRRLVYISVIIRDNIQRMATVSFMITHPMDRNMLN